MLIYWAIPIVAFAAAFVVLAKDGAVSAGKTSAGSAGPHLSIPGFENVSSVCHKFRVRELWLLSATPTPVGDEKGIELMVEFEPDAKVDYPAFLRLQAHLGAMAGTSARLILKRTDWHAAPTVTGPQARVLYAAAA